MGDPAFNEPWERLDEVISHVYKFENGRGMSISMTFVDSGGLRTQEVYKQCRSRLQKRVFAIKGKGGDGIPYTRPPNKVDINIKGQTVGKTWLYTIGVDSGKSDIMSSLKVQTAGPKYCHFPKDEARGYDLKFFNGLLSEKMVMKTDRGRTRWAWEKLKGHERNEALDCRNYALAAFRVLDPDLDAVERRLKNLPKVEKKKQEAVKRPRTKKNRAISGYDW